MYDMKWYKLSALISSEPAYITSSCRQLATTSLQSLGWKWRNTKFQTKQPYLATIRFCKTTSCGVCAHSTKLKLNKQNFGWTPEAFSVFKSQPDNECADSPTLTINSERSEITKASVDCNFHRGQQQFVRDREVNVPKPQKMQQPGYNDMQMLQQHMMFKQLQEFQRQQQLGDLRQQNPLNQFPVTTRQVARAPSSPLINGTPVDAQNMQMNWMQPGAAPGVSNKVIFPQEQGQAMLSMGLTQQIDGSLYGTPVSNTRGNMSQYLHFQGMPQNSVNMLAKAGGQDPAVSDFGVPKQELEMKSNFGQLPIRSINSGNFLGDLQERNAARVNTSTKQFNGKQEQGSSQGLVPLDPMEAKILYNMDENIWDAFGSRPETGAAGVGNNTSEHPDSSYSFSSIQGGTWSALMQSAVAEASSSDTGIKEEWSGSTFQNTEQSTDNHISNFVDSERQQTSWVDNNLKSGSSFNLKPLSMVTDPRTSSSFPGFHQSGMQLLTKQREDYCNDSSRESAVNYNPQKPAIRGGEKDQIFIHWTGKMFEHSQSATKHESQEKQQNRQQRESSNNSLKDLNSHEKGHHEQLKFFDNFSRSPMNLDKGSAFKFQGSPRASEEVPSRGDDGSNASTSFHGSVLPEGSNISSQTSEHILELLHKVDQSNDGADSRDAQMHSQSSASQGFGLRLAPPYQKLANPNSVPSHARSPLVTNDLNSRQVKEELEEKSQACNRSPSPLNYSSLSHEVAQRTHWDNRSGSPGPTSLSRYANVQGNSAVSFLPNRLVTSNSFQESLPGSTSKFLPFNQVPSHDTFQQMHSYSVSQPFSVLDTMHTSHHSNLSQQGENSARPYNVWRNVPIQRQQSPNNNMSSTSWAAHVPVEPNSLEEENKSSEVSTSSNLRGYGCMEELAGKEILQQHVSSNILDTSSGGGTAQGQDNISRNDQAALHSRSPQEIVAVGCNDSQTQSSSKNMISNPTEHGHVNLQMANSWFKQYGSLRNGQMSPMFDPTKADTSQFSLGKPSQNLHMQSSLQWVDGDDAATSMLESQKVQSPYTNQVAIMRPKKRKIMTLELRPRHKEVIQDSGRLQNLSVAEQDWAQATNRLTEKVEDEIALIEDVQPIRRSKRRLVLTTQLVQQLFHPAPASILSADATANYGIISYFISRLSLGDTCSFAHSSVKDFLAPLRNSNSEKPKTAQRNSQQILEVVNNLNDRTKQLENDLQRLDKTASVAIIREEILELEKFTVINRFAKFHVRGQIDASGSSLSAGVLQRHIIAIPMPQNLPEGVRCLSL
ncbi:dentin sialophosphoprotein-related [Euphorbia peplus]|nr:dentin sialophosphoprotein-related [Euphorbia peplus]